MCGTVTKRGDDDTDCSGLLISMHFSEDQIPQRVRFQLHVPSFFKRFLMILSLCLCPSAEYLVIIVGDFKEQIAL